MLPDLPAGIMAFLCPRPPWLSMFPVPSDAVRDQVLCEGGGEHLLLEETCAKALGSAVQVNVEVTSTL